MFAVTQTSTLYLAMVSIGRENTVAIADSINCILYKTGIKRCFPEMKCSTMYFSSFSCKTVSQYCILISSGACVCLFLVTRHFNTVNESLKVTSLYSALYKMDTSLIRTLCSVPLVSALERFDCIPFFFFWGRGGGGGEGIILGYLLPNTEIC